MTSHNLTSPQRRGDADWLNNALTKVRAVVNSIERQKLAETLADEYVSKGGSKPKELIVKYLLAASR